MTGLRGPEPPRVWYAAYGSNLSRARFQCYIEGGRAEGAKRVLPGCRDRSDPADDRAWTTRGQLIFAKLSTNWGGGVAFLDTEAVSTAFLRIYLVTSEQFADIHEQEGPGFYPRVVHLGDVEEHPVLTVTDRTSDFRRPSDPYLGYVLDGLAEAHGLTRAEAVEYVSRAPGMATELS